MGTISSGISRLTTPLLPDDYLALVNPMWHQSALRGRIHRISSAGPQAVTITLRTSRPIERHRAGQFIQLGIDIDGVRHWRSYSITSAPQYNQRDIDITVKATEHGIVSRHLNFDAAFGTVVQLREPSGDFSLPDRPPAKILLVGFGSGVTPIAALARELTFHSSVDVVMIVGDRTSEEVILADEIRSTDVPHIKTIEWYSRKRGRITVDDLYAVVPDWRERLTYLSGPQQFVDDAVQAWEANERTSMLHIERFLTARKSSGSGGSVTFAKSATTCTTSATQSILEAGEDAGLFLPNGCRQGVCHTCVLPLKSGQVQDMRTGEVHGAPGDVIQTCISAPVDDLEIDW